MELVFCCIFSSRTKMIEYLHKKYITNLSQIFKISIVHCIQINQSIVNYFEDQRYESFKIRMLTVNMNRCIMYSKRRQNMPIFIPDIQGKWCINKKEYQKCYYEREKGNTKSERKKEK